MESMPVTAKLLTAEAFQPYGDLIEVGAEPRIINYGNTERHHDLAALDLMEQSGKPIVSIFRSMPLPLPMQLTIMERHPLSSQAFMPLGQQPYLVVVAKAGEFELANVEVFLARAGQGVNYHRGTWHHFCLALNEGSDFLVIDREGGGSNCDEVLLKKTIRVDLSEVEQWLTI